MALLERRSPIQVYIITSINFNIELTLPQLPFSQYEFMLGYFSV